MIFGVFIFGGFLIILGGFMILVILVLEGGVGMVLFRL